MARYFGHPPQSAISVERTASRRPWPVAVKGAQLSTQSNRVADPERAKARAESMFKKENQRREGEKAMAEYLAEREAVRRKTERLRALRLARDAGQRSAPAQPPVPPARASKRAG
jgi:hypothetical protein